MNTLETTAAGRRIAALVDDGSFVEIGTLVRARATDFNLQSQETPGDGVITGYATIEGKLVYVYSQDATVYGGSIGEMHAKKIVRMYDMAVKMGAPVIGLVDCAGLRLEEATDALDGFGQLYLSQAQASGIVPQITAVYGTCGGGMAVAAAMSDFVFMEEKNAKLFVNSPNALDGNYKEKCDTSAPAFQSENTGILDGVGTEEEIAGKIRQLINMLPSNNDDVAVVEGTDDLNRVCEELEGMEDIHVICAALADNGVFAETKKDFAPDMVTGFLKLDGATVGVVGNQETELTPKGCEKASAFVDFCDAFEIPVLTLTNVTGFKATMCTEKNIAKQAGKLTYSFANATVPKVNVILGKAFGSGYNIMNSKSIGADIVYAVEGAQVGMMEANLAARIICNDDADQLAKVTEEYAKKQTAEAAAAHGYVDDIIPAKEMRKRVIASFEMLFSKREVLPEKKHRTK